MSEAEELLTEDEHKAMGLTVRLWNTLTVIVGDGRTGAADLAELTLHLHAIQRAVMSQAAARAYPDLYRPLGQ